MDPLRYSKAVFKIISNGNYGAAKRAARHHFHPGGDAGASGELPDHQADQAAHRPEALEAREVPTQGRTTRRQRSRKVPRVRGH